MLDQGPRGHLPPIGNGWAMVDKLADMANLIDLARRDQAVDRERLLDQLGDIFIAERERLSERERALIADILRKLIADVEREVRRRLAERLSAIDAVPHEIVEMLVHDDIDVARPILLRSRVLSDPDLIEVVKWRSQEHRLVVAMREGLSDAVAHALIESGDEDVIATLVENHDSRLSTAAINYLVEESRRVDRFQEPLLKRPELSPELAHRMFWWVSAALRRYILQHWTGDAQVLDQHLEAATVSALSEEPAPQPSRAEELAAELSSVGRLDGRFLLQSLRQGRIKAFAAGLARMTGTDLATAQSIVFNADGDALAVACRAVDIERNTFASLFLLTRSARDQRGGQGPAHPAQIERKLAFYDSISRDQARTALRYWRRNSPYLKAVRDLERDISG